MSYICEVSGGFFCLVLVCFFFHITSWAICQRDKVKTTFSQKKINDNTLNVSPSGRDIHLPDRSTKL